MFPATGFEDVGMLQMEFRERTDAIGRKELGFIQQVAKHALQSIPRRNGEEASSTLLARVALAMGNVAGQGFSGLPETFEAVLETRKAPNFFLLPDFHPPQTQPTPPPAGPPPHELTLQL